MKITGMTLWKTTVTCKRPFKIATGSSDRCHGLLLQLQTDTGAVGWGEGVPLPYLTGETFSGCRAVLEDIYLPLLLGQDPLALRELRRRLDRAAVNQPAARCALDLALHDLVARHLDLPVWRYLGGDGRPVATNYSIGLATPEDAAQQARALVEGDWTRIKLKVGQDPDLDWECVRAVRSAVGPEILLRLDANEGWNYVQARRFLRRAECLDIELLEQPLARWDLAGMKRLRSHTSIPLAADESVRGVAEARRLAEEGVCDIFNVKLMKCGGLSEALDIATIARAYGIGLMVGGMVGESSVAVAAATTLASVAGFEYADLDADLLLRGNYSTGGAPHSQVGVRSPGVGPGFPLGDLHPEAVELLGSRSA